LDSLTSAFASSSLDEMDQDEEETFFDAVSRVSDAVYDT
jgi:hypothetical protein